MRKTARPIVALAAAALVSGGLAAPAVAGGDQDRDGNEVTIPLTKRTTNELLDGRNHVVATGAADKSSYGGKIVLSFPIREGKHARSAKGGGSDSWALAGGVAFTGAGPNVKWTRLRVNSDRKVITARVGGQRVAILRFAGYGGHHRASGGGGDVRLVLTKAGAASLNRAAQGSPFAAGQTFAGGSDCGR